MMKDLNHILTSEGIEYRFEPFLYQDVEISVPTLRRRALMPRLPCCPKYGMRRTATTTLTSRLSGGSRCLRSASSTTTPYLRVG